MSVTGNPRSAKILLLDLSNLPTKELHHLVVHCATVDDLLVQSRKYETFILIIACTSDKLPELSSALPSISLDTLYILNVGGKISRAIEFWWNKTTVVYNENQLMRHLCTKSMLCYYNEGMAHRKNGNMGLCNACMHNALYALEYSAQFI